MLFLLGIHCSCTMYHNDFGDQIFTMWLNFFVFELNVLTIIGWTAMKFSFRHSCNSFSEPLTFHVVPMSGQNLNISICPILLFMTCGLLFCSIEFGIAIVAILVLWSQK